MSPRAWLGRLTGPALWTWAAACFAFLFAPIVTTVIYSFNRGVLGKQSAAFTGFTTQWYPIAWQNDDLRHSLFISLEVAVCAAVISTTIGVAAGIVLARQRGVVSRVLEFLVYFLVIVPEIVTAISLLVFYVKSGVTLGLLPLIAGHTPFAIAVVALVVRSRVLTLDRTLEHAASDLGARPWAVLRDVQLPQLAPALAAALIISFTFSFDDLVTSLFLTTPTVTTLPVFILGTVHAGTTPDIYAVASVVLAATIVDLAVAALVYRWQRARLSARRSFAARPGDAAQATA